MCIFFLSLPYLFLSLRLKQMLHKQFISFYTIYDLTPFYKLFLWQSSRFYHSSYNFFHMGNHTDSCQPVPFFNNFDCYEKFSHCQWLMPNLCYIIYIDLCIGAFNLQTTFNDSYLVQFILYQIKMMGEW